MLCWANENWTRVWDGGDKDVLLEQHYSLQDDLEHIRSLIPYFKDRRYIRVNNKPVIAIYRSTLLPDVRSTIHTWRSEAAKHGLDLYICRFESCQIGGPEYLEPGFDAAIDLQPWSREMNGYREQRNQELFQSFAYRAEQFFYRRIVKHVAPKAFAAHRLRTHDKLYNGYQFDYGDYVQYLLKQPLPAYKVFPGITSMWDNSSRRKSHPVLCSMQARHYTGNGCSILFSNSGLSVMMKILFSSMHGMSGQKAAILSHAANGEQPISKLPGMYSGNKIWPVSITGVKNQLSFSITSFSKSINSCCPVPDIRNSLPSTF